MSDQVSVNTDELHTAGRRLIEIAQRLDTEWSTFQTGLQARGDIFGDDDVGGLIGASHQAATELIGKCYTSAATAFGAFGSGLDSMAADYEQLEQQTEQAFQRLTADLGSTGASWA